MNNLWENFCQWRADVHHNNFLNLSRDAENETQMILAMKEMSQYLGWIDKKWMFKKK